MVFGKERLVPTNELDWFLDEIAYYWNQGWSAKKIAEEMGIGEEYAKKDAEKYGVPFGTVGYPELKVRHIYYFVERYGKAYGMTPRRKHKTNASKTQIPHFPDMPTETANYLRDKGLLIGQ